MIRLNGALRLMFAGLLGFASVGCLGGDPHANDPSSAAAAPAASDEAKPEGAAELVNATPGSGNTGNGSPGPEGGPGSLGAGIGSGSGTGTGAGPGNSGSTSGATSR